MWRDPVPVALHPALVHHTSAETGEAGGSATVHFLCHASPTLFRHPSFSPYGPPVRIDACQQLKSKPLFHDNDLNRLSKKKKNPAPIHQPMTSHSSTRAPLCVHGTKAAKARPDLMVLSHQQLLCASLQWRLDAALMRSPSPHPEPRLEQVHQRRPPMGGVDSSFVGLSHESFPSPCSAATGLFPSQPLNGTNNKQLPARTVNV